MTTSPCTVTLVTNTSSSQSFDVLAGVTKLTLQITAGGMMYGKIERDGNIVVELDPQFTFNPNPTTHNYSAMVTSVDSNQTVTPPADGLLTITRPRPPWCPPPRWFIRLLLVGEHNLSGSSDHNPLLHSQSLTFAFAFSPPPVLRSMVVAGLKGAIVAFPINRSIPRTTAQVTFR